MRVLLLTHAFNSLTQRLWVELVSMGHEPALELDINSAVTIEAVELFRPHLILAPFLKRAIPESIWRNHCCLVFHPGIPGDRGPSALDWAVLEREKQWGLTLFQAEAEMDAGPIWAAEGFAMRPARKSGIYRREVTEAAVRALHVALGHFPGYLAGRWRPVALADWPDLRGRPRPLMRQVDRAIRWDQDSTRRVLAKCDASDGRPGVRDRLFGADCSLFDCRPYPGEGEPGALIGRCLDGLVRASADGAVWIGQVRHPDAEVPVKLPALLAFPEAAELPELGPAPVDPIHYRESVGVGYLSFDFYNGAMGTDACRRLLAAYEQALHRPTRVLVLAGGEDFFSNGLDLNRIEAAGSPADESMANIEVMDDLCQALIETSDRLTVAALRGNAGAGGAFLALAADQVWAARGVVLNPHYKNMGNLYGSEYWTYLLPGRVGAEQATEVMQGRLPIGAGQALRLGFVDALIEGPDLDGEIRRRAEALAASPDLGAAIEAKAERRRTDEAARLLADYRAAELSQMRRNFYGFDPSYHVARHHFVHKTPHSWTPRHLAPHREPGWVVPSDPQTKRPGKNSM